MHEKHTHRIFKDTYDNPNLTPEQVKVDLESITMVPIKHGPQSHKRCKPEQFARIHWKATLTGSNHLVQDTHFASGVDNPVEFKIGHSHLTHCLDLAVP